MTLQEIKTLAALEDGSRLITDFQIMCGDLLEQDKHGYVNNLQKREMLLEDFGIASPIVFCDIQFKLSLLEVHANWKKLTNPSPVAVLKLILDMRHLQQYLQRNVAHSGLDQHNSRTT